MSRLISTGLPFCFSREYRLKNKHDFQSVFAKPRKVTRPRFTVLFIPNQKTHARIGIIISKSRLRQAVLRNAVRRIVRESFRQHKEMLKGLDIVVLLRSECSALDKKQIDKQGLRSDVDQLWPALLAKPS